MATKFYSNITMFGTLTVGVDDTGHDVQFFGATAGKSLLWDESADRLIFADNTYLALGSGSDMLLYHSDTHGYIFNQKGNFLIQNTANGNDIIFKCDDGSGGNATYLTLDGGTKTIEVDVPINVGEDNTGYDVKFFGATSGQYMLWDESADTLFVTGEIDAGSLDISGDADIDGRTNLDIVDIDGAVDMASTLSVVGNISTQGAYELRSMSTPSAPAAGQAIIWMDSSNNTVYVKVTDGEGSVSTCALCPAGEGGGE